MTNSVPLESNVLAWSFKLRFDIYQMFLATFGWSSQMVQIWYFARWCGDCGCQCETMSHPTIGGHIFCHFKYACIFCIWNPWREFEYFKRQFSKLLVGMCGKVSKLTRLDQRNSVGRRFQSSKRAIDHFDRKQGPVNQLFNNNKIMFLRTMP